MFGNLFKGEAAREQAAREKLAAYDQGRDLGAQLTTMIDAFRNKHAVPVYRQLLEGFKNNLQAHHHDPLPSMAIEMLSDFDFRLSVLKDESLKASWEQLGEWKDIIVTMKVKE